jgi:hypothetical protein
LVAYAPERDWDLPPEQIYQDDGCSGARLDGPALDRLRDAAAVARRTFAWYVEEDLAL